MLKTENLEMLDINLEEGNWLFETIKTIFDRINKEKDGKKYRKYKKKDILRKPKILLPEGL